jgi:hypothetical protein
MRKQAPRHCNFLKDMENIAVNYFISVTWHMCFQIVGA